MIVQAKNVLVSYVALLTLVSLPVVASDAHWEQYHPSKQEQAALESISPNSLKANLAFLASDLLEGRGTPSRGLDIAAEFIATQFQRAGLEPAGDDRYFQTADWVPRRRPTGENPTGESQTRESQTRENQTGESRTGESPPAKVRNVVGLLRGSDPAFANTYILVTAHYDHLGMKPDGDDRIFNGANDDGSGVASVLELAQVLGAMKQRPKRSIVFMTFYGEEHGLIGSHYYGAHPLFPIDKTVANINVEQVGRTDDSDNPGPGLAQVTGMDYSEIGKILEIAGNVEGVRVFKHERYSDPFFSQSDNRALADLGIPAHTFSNSYFFPDAHKVGDHADRIDYENMARLNRVVALAVLMIANNKNEPQWDAGNPMAAKYANARKR